MSLKSNNFNKVIPADYLTGSAYASLVHDAGYEVIHSKQHNGVGASLDNLFSVVGPIHVLEMIGYVTDVTNVAAVTLARLEAIGSGAAVPITLAAGTDLSGMALGSIVERHGDATTALGLHDAAALDIEDETVALILSPFRMISENGVTNYIRFGYTGGAGTDFTINWFMRWRPLGVTPTVAAVVPV